MKNLPNSEMENFERQSIVANEKDAEYKRAVLAYSATRLMQKSLFNQYGAVIVENRAQKFDDRTGIPMTRLVLLGEAAAHFSESNIAE